MNRRALVVAVIIVALLAYAGAWVSAGAGADDYRRDWRLWADANKPQLRRMSALPEGIFIVKGDVTSAEALKKQQMGCDAIAARIDRVEHAVSTVPRFSGGPFGFLRGTSRDLADTSDRRERAVLGAGERASEALRQILVDCRWNIELNTRSSVDDPYWKQAERYREAKGVIARWNTTAIVCRVLDGCLSPDLEKRRKEIDVSLKAWKAWEDSYVPLYEGEACSETSFTEAICEFELAAQKQRVKDNIAYWEWLKTVSRKSNLPGIDKRLKALAAADDHREAKGRKLFKAEFPQIFAQNMDAASSTDVFFAIVARDLFMDAQVALAEVAGLE